MLSTALVGWLHIVAVVAWMGGLIYQLYVLLPTAMDEKTGLPTQGYLQAALRFRPLSWVALGLIALSGVSHVGQAGGMGHLPVLIHIKIAVALLMVITWLLVSLSLLPSLSKAMTDGESEKALTLHRQATLLSSLVVGLGLIALYLLTRAIAF